MGSLELRELSQVICDSSDIGKWFKVNIESCTCEELRDDHSISKCHLVTHAVFASSILQNLFEGHEPLGNPQLGPLFAILLVLISYFGEH